MSRINTEEILAPNRHIMETIDKAEAHYRKQRIVARVQIGCALVGAAAGYLIVAKHMTKETPESN